MNQEFLMVKSPKSSGIAILLVLLLGPIGVFYASVSGGIILTFVIPGIFLVLLFGGSLSTSGLMIFLISSFIGVIFYWIVCIIWAMVAVSDYNFKLRQSYARLRKIENQELNIAQLKPTSNISSDPSWNQLHGRPTVQEWMRSNPGKTVNDYYFKFGSD